MDELNVLTILHKALNQTKAKLKEEGELIAHDDPNFYEKKLDIVGKRIGVMMLTSYILKQLK